MRRLLRGVFLRLPCSAIARHNVALIGNLVGNPFADHGQLAALAIGFIPPSQFGHLNPVTYVLLILTGVLLIGVLPPFLLDRFRKPAWKAASGS